MKHFLYRFFNGLSLITLLLILLCSSKYSQAQLSGSYTIGSGGNYSTITSAVSALNSQGVDGAVTFNVLTGTYTEHFVIGSISGTSGSNTIVFQSQSGNAADVTVQYTATTAGDNYIAQLNGADYVTFQNLTFTAWGTSYGRIIQFTDNSDNNTIANCILNGISTTSSSTNVALIISTASSSTSDNLNITNNTFNDGGYSIYIYGVNGSNRASGTEISGNTLNNVAYGMNLAYHNDLIVSGNTVQATRNYGIYVQNSDGAMEITKNKISAGSGYGLYLYVCDGGAPPTGTSGLVANNFITVNTNNSSGIYLYSSTRQNIYYNSVNSRSGTSSRAFELYNGSNINMVNNNFANHGGGYAYYVHTPAAIGTSNYNNIYSAGNYVAYWGTSNLSTLAALQTASSKDANSLSVYHHYASGTDLHTVAPWLDGVGTILSEVTDDIDGESRAGSPDIGADQFVPDPTATTPLSGTFTIGSGGDYSDFSAASADLLLKGISAPVTFNIINGNYQEQVAFHETPGASAVNTITFQSQSGNAAEVLLWHFAAAAGDNYVVYFRGADFMRFRNMTMMTNNVAPVSYGRIFYLWGGVEDLIIEGNTLNGSPTNSSSANLALIYGVNMLPSPRIIRNNIFNDGGYSIHLYGLSSSILSTGTEISGNTLNNVAYGMNLGNQKDLIVSGNTVQATRSNGIYVYYGDGAMEITKNKISTGSGYGLYLYACDGGVLPTGTPGLVANNFITGNANNSNGIYLYSSTRQNIYYNSVNSHSGTSSRAFELYNGSNINMVNNNFANHGGGYAYYVHTPAAIGTSNYNNIYSSGNYKAFWGTLNLSTLAALQTASSKDANSLSVYHHYASGTDLHTVAPWLDGMGTILSEVTDDIDGETRGGSPDIGADQFVPDPAATTPLSGTFTIGSGGDYSDFSAASADLLLKGISAPVTFNIINGNYQEQVAFHETPGASAVNTITFQSQSGNAAEVLLWHFAAAAGDNYVVYFRGADFMRFRNMTMMTNNVAPVSYGRIFYLWGGVEDLIIEGNTLNGSPTNSSSANLALIYGLNMLPSPRVIRNNTFNDGGYSIHLYGLSNTILSTGTEITGNTLNNVAYGINLGNQKDLKVNGNTIDATQNYGIYVIYGDGAMEITKNKISTGSGYGLHLYVCDGGVPPTGTPGLVANNFITGNANNSNGIYLHSSTRQNIYFNSVNSHTGINSRAFELYNGSDINIVNNNFANHGGGYAYVVHTPAAIGTSNYNNIYSAGNYVAYWGTSNLSTLAALQTASSKDANSLSVYHHYASGTDLHTVAPWLDGVGTILSEVTDDIDGETRGGSPDIGADQFVADPTSTTPLSGAFTIGSGGDYSDFSAASADLLLKGISSAVTFNVINGNYQEQVAFHETPGASVTNTITFQSQSGNAADVLLWHFAAATVDNYVALFRGADFMRFRNMTMMTNNVTPVSFGRTFYLWGGVEDLIIEGNTLNGSPTNSSSANLALIYGINMLPSPRVIRNNIFNDGGYSIHLYGLSNTILSTGTEITGNTLNNVAYGINLGNQKDLKVNGNTIDATQNYGIYVIYGDGAMEITKNKISTGSGYGLHLYVCDGGVPPTGIPGLIANNFITSNANSTHGIYLHSSTRQNIYFNSVNSRSGINSRAFELYNGSDINVVNNIFANFGGGFTYYINTPSAIGTSNYNDFYTTGVNLAYLGGNITDLAALQAANSKDANSISVNPQFISNTNLHIRAAELDSTATSLAEVTDDIDGEPRNALFPDIGADEFIFGFNYSPAITSLPDTTAFADSLYKYQVTAADHNGDTLIYRLSTAPSFLSIDSTTGLIQGTPAQGNVGDHIVSIEVDDKNGGTANQIFTLNVQPPVGINQSGDQIPKKFALKQNYPNPFNPTTTIEYDLPLATHVKIEVFNLLGQKIKTIIDGYKNAGHHQVIFDSQNLASGVYFYKIKAGAFLEIKKMTLLR